MAGHRHKHGHPARSTLRAEKLRQRVAAARTPAERLAAAYDGFRSAVSRMGDRPEADRLTGEAAEYLLSLTAKGK